jgi:hypothetical protein
MTEQIETSKSTETEISPIKIILTSLKPVSKLTEQLEKLEVNVEWIPLGQEMEEGFTFTLLKPAFDRAMEAKADLVVAVDEELNLFAVGTRKDLNAAFVLLNVHQLLLILSKLLLENHPDMELHRSLLIAQGVDILFKANELSVKVYGDLPSPVSSAKVYLDIPEGALVVSENQEILLKGHQDSLGYLLGRIIEASQQLKSSGKSLFSILVDIYKLHGHQQVKLLSASQEDESQRQFYTKIFEKLRKKTPKLIGMDEIESVEDFENGTVKNAISGRIVNAERPFARAILVHLNSQIRFLMYPKDDKVYFLFDSTVKVMTTAGLGDVNKLFNQRIFKLVSEINRLG